MSSLLKDCPTKNEALEETLILPELPPREKQVVLDQWCGILPGDTIFILTAGGESVISDIEMDCCGCVSAMVDTLDSRWLLGYRSDLIEPSLDSDIAAWTRNMTETELLDELERTSERSVRAENLRAAISFRTQHERYRKKRAQHLVGQQRIRDNI